MLTKQQAKKGNWVRLDEECLREYMTVDFIENWLTGSFEKAIVQFTNKWTLNPQFMQGRPKDMLFHKVFEDFSARRDLSADEIKNNHSLLRQMAYELLMQANGLIITERDGAIGAVFYWNHVPFLEIPYLHYEEVEFLEEGIYNDPKLYARGLFNDEHYAPQQ